MEKRNSKIDEYISKAKRWKEEYVALRELLLQSELKEELKWYAPCYTLNNANLIMIGGFKEHITLSFFNGALLKDPYGVLVKPGENSQAVRMFKFTSVEQIQKNEAIIKEYIQESIDAEKAGLKVDFKEKTELQYVKELQDKIDSDGEFKKAFEALTPGRRRAYNLFFSAPKQSITRVQRIEKLTSKILEGKGFSE